ncbi:hypothetical protein P3T37_006066 [Kitasatospora sp. MAA4]|nr:hypothetical protein [Kitasatospora sp. MAA4]
MEASDAEHGVVDAVALEAAAAKDLPVLHAGEDVLDAGADLLVIAGMKVTPAFSVLARAPTIISLSRLVGLPDADVDQGTRRAR